MTQEKAKYYGSGTWKRIRAIQLKKASLCQHCLKSGRLTVATVCDHIQPWESWQDFCRGPFQSLCPECHTLKTAFFDVPLTYKRKRCKMEVKDV